MKERYYFVHVYLRGNRREDLFYDQTDFRCVWNRMWLAAYYTETKILAAELLTNHLHIILKVPAKVDCEPGEIKFMHYFRMSMTHYINRRYEVGGSLGSRSFGRSILADVIDDNGEDLRDAICYTLRNVKHHNIIEEFRKWTWSTVNFAFGLDTRKSYYVSPNIPQNILKRILPYGKDLPKNWKVTTDYIIIPDDTVFDREFVEELFKSKDNYQSTLDNTTLRELRHDNEDDAYKRKITKRIQDLEIINYIQSISDAKILQMDTEQKYFAARQVCKLNPYVKTSQLSRILEVPYSTLKRKRTKWQ